MFSCSLETAITQTNPKGGHVYKAMFAMIKATKKDCLMSLSEVQTWWWPPSCNLCKNVDRCSRHPPITEP